MLPEVSVSVPASVMLLGEHAVLHGYPAVVCAVNQRMHIQATRREDEKIIIDSDLGHYESSCQNLSIEAPFQFVLRALQGISQGVQLKIRSGFSHQVGLGSSAAVTVGVVAALAKLFHTSFAPEDIYAKAFEVIYSVQNLGSGADVAASVYGGVLAYQRDPLNIISLPLIPDLCLFYSGSKMPTAQVIAHIQKNFSDRESELHQLYADIGRCASNGITAIQAEDWLSLGKIMRKQQSLMEKLGVCNPALEKLIQQFSDKTNAIKGVKISGSGLGDCIITLGKHESMLESAIPIEVSPKGFYYE